MSDRQEDISYNNPYRRAAHSLPQLLVGEDTAMRVIPELWVSEFKRDKWRGTSDRSRLRASLDEYSLHGLDEVRARINKDRGRSVPGTVHIGRTILQGLQEKLVDPKVVVGRITQLHILRIMPDEIPAPMMTKFKRPITPPYTYSFDRAYGQTSEHVADHDRYYRIFGKLSAGSTSAPIACGVRVASFVSELSHPDTGRYYEVDASAQVEKYGKAGMSAEAQAWDQSIADARIREAEALLNPLTGGLMNPR